MGEQLLKKLLLENFIFAYNVVLSAPSPNSFCCNPSHIPPTTFSSLGKRMLSLTHLLHLVLPVSTHVWGHPAGARTTYQVESLKKLALLPQQSSGGLCQPFPISAAIWVGLILCSLVSAVTATVGAWVQQHCIHYTLKTLFGVSFPLSLRLMFSLPPSSAVIPEPWRERVWYRFPI